MRPLLSLMASSIALLSAPAWANVPAPYELELWGIGDGANAYGVYLNPYQGSISEGGKQIYSGYVICDDFYTHSYLWTPWSATATNAGNLNGSEKFAGESYGPYDTAQMYNAAAWLANQLVAGSNVHDPTAQTNLSFAIWDIMDGNAAQSGGISAEISAAFGQVLAGYRGGNVDVFTPSPRDASQEFLVVNGPPVPVPEPATLALFTAGFAAIALARLRRLA